MPIANHLGPNPMSTRSHIAGNFAIDYGLIGGGPAELFLFWPSLVGFIVGLDHSPQLLSHHLTQQSIARIEGNQERAKV